VSVAVWPWAGWWPRGASSISPGATWPLVVELSAWQFNSGTWSEILAVVQNAGLGHHHAGEGRFA